MGRQSNNDPAAVVGPSIALLQERFRKLERMKEKIRESEDQERQVLMFSAAEPRRRMIISAAGGGSSMAAANELFQLPSRSRSALHPDPLSLGLNLNTNNYKHEEYYRALKSNAVADQPPNSSSFNSLWSADKRGVKRPHKFDLSDVDTSLHL